MVITLGSGAVSKATDLNSIPGQINLKNSFPLENVVSLSDYF